VRGITNKPSLLPGTLLVLGSACAGATSVDISIDPGLFKAPTAPENGQLSSGLDMSLRNQLVALDVGYDIEVRMDGEQIATHDSTFQKLGATLQSKPLDRLLGVNTRLQANSLFTTATGGYDHRLAPGFSRRILDLATLDVNYQYHLNRPSAEAAIQEKQGYALGLTGSLQGGRITWNGIYSADHTYHDSQVLTNSNETYHFRSNYQLLPHMQLQFSSAVTHKTEFRSAEELNILQTQYGAGLRWTPSARYSLDFRVDQTGLSHTGEETLLRSGTVSWHPRHNMSLSLNYGDQLLEGEPGVLFNTRFLLDRF
jgi:hypothetical protein